ncbi:hypothetical protein V7S43_017879 [Phytophthora oleae]|uniref:Elicitin-like protein n=1 Tax=Phytophthora oleae TaxID=2107226 RepID=A0ABD3EVT3_9STRA
MKPSVLLFALVLASTNSLVRADCTSEDLAAINEIYAQAIADGPASCPTEAPAGNTDQYCEYAACLRGHTEIVDEIPNCIHEGFSLRDGLKAAFDLCEDISTDSSGSTSSSGIASSDSSSSSALATNSSTIAPDSSSSSTTTDASDSSELPADSTSSSSASTTGNNIAADSGSASSSASSIALAASSVGVAMTAFIFAVGL